MIGRIVAIVLALAIHAPSVGVAAEASSDGRVHVRGYTRKDGTYVRPHTRSWPRSSSAYSAPPVSGPETSTSQGPVMYYNPFVERPDTQQNSSRNATLSDADAGAVTHVDREYARKLLALLDEQDAAFQTNESAMKRFVGMNQHRFTASGRTAFDALRDAFNAVRRQRDELRRDAEAVASGKVDSTEVEQMHERVQLYVTTLNNLEARASSPAIHAEQLAVADDRSVANSAPRPTAGMKDEKTAHMDGAYATRSELAQRQAEFDAATGRFHSLFTALVAAAKAQQITKEEFATGIVNVSLMQIELNKTMEAHNRQQPAQAVVIDARHTWYESVDHIVSEVIPRR